MRRSISLIKKTKKVLSRAMRLCFFAALLFFIWIAIAPREIPIIAFRLSSVITSLLPENIAVDINKIYIGFENFYKPAAFLKNVVLASENRGTISLEEVILTVDPLAIFPQSQRKFLNFQLRSPEIRFSNLKSKSPDNKNNLKGLNDFFEANKNKLLKYSIDFKNTNIIIEDLGNENREVMINHAILKPSLRQGNLIFILYSDITAGDKSNVIDVIIDTNHDNQIQIKGNITNIANPLLKNLGYNIAPLENATFEADMQFNALLRGFTVLDYLEFELNNFEGMIRQNEYFAKDIKTKSATIRGYCFNNCSEIEVDKMLFNTKHFESYRQILPQNE